MKRVLLGTLGLLLCGLSGAAPVAPLGSGAVTSYVVFESNGVEVLIFRTASITNQTACNTSSRFAMSANDPKFRSTQAAVLAAQLSGTFVYAIGKGTCDAFPNSQDLFYLCLGNEPC